MCVKRTRGTATLCPQCVRGSRRCSRGGSAHGAARACVKENEECADAVSPENKMKARPAPTSNQPTLVAFLAASSGDAPPPTRAPRPAEAGAQRTLFSLARVVTLPRGVPAADHLRTALPALQAEAAEAEPAAALAALRRLACVDVSRTDLATTGAGAAVRRLKACPHYDVSVAAARLVEKWKSVVRREVEGAERKAARGEG